MLIILKNVNFHFHMNYAIVFIIEPNTCLRVSQGDFILVGDSVDKCFFSWTR